MNQYQRQTRPQIQTQRPRQPYRNFGGLRFPDIAEPPPGPLSVLATELAQEKPSLEPSYAVSQMLEGLPRHLRTQVLQKSYMGILERLAQCWQNPHALRQLFDDLIFESRTSRCGLSFEAIVELTELQDHVKRAKFRDRPSVWDEALGLV